MLESLAQLFERDLDKVIQELRAYPDEQSVWEIQPGVLNSAGTLALHLSGNLMQFIGVDLGGLAYQRDREAEFSRRGVPRAELIAGLQETRRRVGQTLRGLDASRLSEVPVHLPPSFAPDTTVYTFLLHLYGHLNWHLGQVNYLRRIVTA